MRLLRFRTRGMGRKDGQGSWTPLLAQTTPGNTRQREAMDARKGGTTMRGKRLSERTMSHAKLDMLIDETAMMALGYLHNPRLRRSWS